MSRLPSRLLGAGVALLILPLGACEKPRPTPKPEAASGTGSEVNPARVSLTPEAIRQAGISTQVIRRSPLAVMLSLTARLSSVPETNAEMEARLATQAAQTRFQRASSALERARKLFADKVAPAKAVRSEEHTSELQSLRHLVCRLLLEKKKTK